MIHDGNNVIYQTIWKINLKKKPINNNSYVLCIGHILKTWQYIMHKNLWSSYFFHFTKGFLLHGGKKSIRFQTAMCRKAVFKNLLQYCSIIWTGSLFSCCTHAWYEFYPYKDMVVVRLYLYILQINVTGTVIFPKCLVYNVTWYLHSF